MRDTLESEERGTALVEETPEVAPPAGSGGSEPDEASMDEGANEPGPEGARAEEGGEDEAAAGAPGPGDAVDDEELARNVAALVFASPEPVPIRRLVQLLDGPRPGRVRDALNEIARRLDAAGLPIELREIAGGWRFMTAPEAHEAVAKLSGTRRTERLSAAGLETLAVIAYRQPVTKAEIEAIRGVQCGAMLRGLIDRGLVRATGRAEQPGHPLQYGTTRAFLDRFGLASLKDLPRDGELLGE